MEHKARLKLVLSLCLVAILVSVLCFTFPAIKVSGHFVPSTEVGEVIDSSILALMFKIPFSIPGFYNSYWHIYLLHALALCFLLSLLFTIILLFDSITGMCNRVIRFLIGIANIVCVVGAGVMMFFTKDIILQFVSNKFAAEGEATKLYDTLFNNTTVTLPVMIYIAIQGGLFAILTFTTFFEVAYGLIAWRERRLSGNKQLSRSYIFFYNLFGPSLFYLKLTFCAIDDFIRSKFLYPIRDFFSSIGRGVSKASKATGKFIIHLPKNSFKGFILFVKGTGIVLFQISRPIIYYLSLILILFKKIGLLFVNLFKTINRSIFKAKKNRKIREISSQELELEDVLITKAETKNVDIIKKNRPILNGFVAVFKGIGKFFFQLARPFIYYLSLIFVLFKKIGLLFVDLFKAINRKIKSSKKIKKENVELVNKETVTNKTKNVKTIKKNHNILGGIATAFKSIGKFFFQILRPFIYYLSLIFVLLKKMIIACIKPIKFINKKIGKYVYKALKAIGLGIKYVIYVIALIIENIFKAIFYLIKELFIGIAYLLILIIWFILILPTLIYLLIYSIVSIISIIVVNLIKGILTILKAIVLFIPEFIYTRFTSKEIKDKKTNK